MSEDLAWAAGFFDGEGSVSYSERRTTRGTKYRALEVSVSQAGMTGALCDRFRAAVQLGEVYGPYQRRNPKHKPYWVWRLSGRDEALALLRLLKPWLGDAKRAQLMDGINDYDEFAPDFEPCEHGYTYSTCSECHRASAAKGWETRRAAA